MPCFHPNRVWRTERGIIFYNPYKDNRHHKGIQIPCGQCVGCRAKRTREWAIRIMHEAQLHPENVFITLTYNQEELDKFELPIEEGGLNKPPQLYKKHFQDFIRSLRKRNPNKKIRYYHCGEYGEKNFRPHYHAIIFNHRFSDIKKLNGHKDLFTSKQLDATWQRGYASIGMVTPESAAYVANYIQKKGSRKKCFPSL